MSDVPNPGSLVFEDGLAADVPGTHAIVIGCGAYRHLPGGSGRLMAGRLSDKLTGMQQLDPMASLSVRHVADWLFREYHEDGGSRPLRSLHLLLSETAPAPYRTPDGVDHELPESTFDNVAAAVKDWRRRGEGSPDNLMIFYFFGHGVAAGNDSALLCADFGADEDDPFGTAIAFPDFYLGMDLCAARSQLFLIDACRTASENLIEAAQSSGGRPIIAGIRAITSDRIAPVYKGAILGGAAFSLATGPSFFAQALTDSYRGAAWRRDARGWYIDSTMMPAAMETYLRRRKARFGALPVRFSPGETPPLALKRPSGEPRVPVDIGFDPPEVIAQAALVCRRVGVGGATPHIRNQEPGTWELELEGGLYEVEARLPGEVPLRESVFAAPVEGVVFFRRAS
jgi:hypothetical protein